MLVLSTCVIRRLVVIARDGVLKPPPILRVLLVA